MKREIKGNVGDISSDLPCKDVNTCFWVSLQKWLAHFLLIRKSRWLTDLNTFRVRKMTLSPTFLIRLSFQGYRCKSDIDIFEWRVTWNYSYTPFKVAADVLKTSLFLYTLLSLIIPGFILITNLWGWNTWNICNQIWKFSDLILAQISIELFGAAH